MQNGLSLYKHKLLTIVSFLLMMLLFSCEKKDNEPPIISIQQPIGGSYSVLDSLQVKASITDNELVASITIRIINNDNQQVCTPLTFKNSSRAFQLNSTFVIDNLYLESGDYYLVVEAQDENNTAKQFVPIMIGAMTRQLEDLLIVEKEHSSTHIFSVIGTKTLLKNFDFEYQDFIYNPYAEQYVFLSSTGIITAYDKDKLEVQWSDNDLKDPVSDFKGTLFYKDKLTYVSAFSGEIRAYDKNGNIVKQAITVDPEGQVSQYYFGHDKIMAFKDPFVNGHDKIERLNEQTGASVYTYNIPFTPEQLLFVNEDLCVVFGNQYNIAKACSLSTLYNVVHPFGEFGSRTFYDAYKYSQYYYILAIDHEIIEYDLSSGNERIVDQTNGAVHFFYEDDSEKLYYVDGAQISVLNFPANGHQEIYTNNKPIDDLIFVYNK